MIETFPPDLTWWQVIVTAISVVGTGLAMVQATRAGLRRRANTRWDRSYKDIGRVYETIQGLMSAGPANRVLVIKSENGGGIPTPDGDVTNTVTHEVCDSDVDPVRKLWNRVKLDRSYSAVITAVNTDGVRDVTLDELPPSALLRDLFETCGCTQARMVRICATPRALLYLCVCVDAKTELAPADRLQIRAAAQTLCSIFANHHQLIKREARQS